MKVLKEHEKGASFYSLEKKYDIVLGTVKRWNAAFKDMEKRLLITTIAIYVDILRSLSKESFLTIYLEVVLSNLLL